MAWEVTATLRSGMGAGRAAVAVREREATWTAQSVAEGKGFRPWRTMMVSPQNECRSGQQPSITLANDTRPRRIETEHDCHVGGTRQDGWPGGRNPPLPFLPTTPTRAMPSSFLLMRGKEIGSRRSRELQVLHEAYQTTRGRCQAQVPSCCQESQRLLVRRCSSAASPSPALTRCP